VFYPCSFLLHSPAGVRKAGMVCCILPRADVFTSRGAATAFDVNGFAHYFFSFVILKDLLQLIMR